MEPSLSLTQHRVLLRMLDGWELAESTSITSGGCWLQQDGIGRGGNVEKVPYGTVHALWKRKLIQEHYAFPTSRYTLTPKGRQLALGRKTAETARGTGEVGT